MIFNFNRGFSGIVAMIILGLTLMAHPILKAQEYLSDNNIETKIDEELFFHLDIPAHRIDVSVNEGIASLSGTVDNILAKERAEKVTMAVKGVSGVLSRIEVMPPGRSDDQLTVDIENAIRDNTATEAFEIGIEARDGVVTLIGAVDSWHEKQLCAYIAKGIRGVKHVNNDIQVQFQGNREDYEIKEEIEHLLNNDIRLYNQYLTVEVEDGRVFLNGTVGTLHEKILAENYAWTNGARSVNVDNVAVHDWANEDHLKDNPNPKRTDEQIEQTIRKAFLYEPKVVSLNPDISVNRGVVTLRGTVMNPAARRTAAEVARNVVGVDYVRNNLKVIPVVIPEKETLESRVQNALERNPIVGHYDFDVLAWDNGIVYLDGLVDSRFEKYHAEDIISGMTGVVKVINDLKVMSVEGYGNVPEDRNHYYSSVYLSTGDYYQIELSDEQIRKNIIRELWWSPYVNNADVEVEVNDGNVTLKGEVTSWLERQAARKNAYKGGAKSVLNLLKIETEDSQ